MHVVVLVKHVPDAQFDRTFTEDLTVDRSESVLSELDEYPLEEALRIKESSQDEVVVTAATMGPVKAATAVRKALQMGVDQAVHLCDDALAGSDASATALALSKLVEFLGSDGFPGVDLVLTGMASPDAEMSIVPAMLAEHLGWAQLTLAKSLTLADRAVEITRDDGQRELRATAELPAVVSVTDMNSPRYPNFKGILAAKKKEIRTVALADLGLTPGQVGHRGSLTRVERVERAPEKQAGQVITDSGDGGVRLVDFLASRGLV